MRPKRDTVFCAIGVVLLAFVVQTADVCAQWVMNGSNIYFSDGNVGINTTTPGAKLEVAGFRNDTPGSGPFRISAVSAASLRMDTWNSLNVDLYNGAAWTTPLTIRQSGNVGLGQTAPEEKLDIYGNAQVKGTFPYFALKSTSWDVSSYIQTNLTADAQAFGNYVGFLNPPGKGFSFVQGGPGGVGPILTMHPGGHVGIGTTSPGGRVEIVSDSQTFPGSYGANLKITSDLYPGVWLKRSGPNTGFLLGVDYAGLNFLSESAGAAVPRLTVNANGNVGIGTTNPSAKLHVDGNIVATTMSTTYQDIAEWVPTSRAISPGMVVILDPESTNSVIPSAEAYDTRVAGVVSDNPGIILGEAGPRKEKIATTGRVRVRVDASNSPIRVGDLLVTSDVAGTAMKSEPIELAGRRIHQPGTLLGKALEPLASGQGEILVLLSLQ